MLNEIKIKIADQEYLIKKSNRALMEFERVTGKSVFNLDDSYTSLITMFYCILKVNNQHFSYTLDKFIDLLDNNQDSIDVFNEFLLKEAENSGIKTDQTTTKKKTVKK
jgi:hypothetical protein